MRPNVEQMENISIFLLILKSLGKSKENNHLVGDHYSKSNVVFVHYIIRFQNLDLIHQNVDYV